MLDFAKLIKACKRPAEASENALRRILELSKDTVFGREHGFSEILKARSSEELFAGYAKSVAPAGYEAFRPYVERILDGESDVLFPGRPCMYATTSGTTNSPKWLPVSEAYLNDVYGVMTRVWIGEMMCRRPRMFCGKVFAVVGEEKEGTARDGLPYGSVSGFTRGRAPAFIERRYTSPACVFGISDYTARYYVLMRMAVEQDVTFMVTANPSTVVELLSNSEEYFDDYIDDIEYGIISERFNIEEDIRRELERYVRPNPRRAAFLRNLRFRYGFRVFPKHYWPNLQILSTWKCGNTSLFVEKFGGTFPAGTYHQDCGYYSSECRFGFPVADSYNSVLFPHLHYYEFVDESELGLEPDKRNFLRLDQLSPGRRYCPFVTTLSGLYRYNMNDLVKAGPRFHNSVTIRMVQKINGIVSITGEKLYEKQFVDAVRTAEVRTGLRTAFFVGFANVAESEYDFFYEFDNKSVTREQAESFTTVVDEALKKSNIEYMAKRDSQRLKSPRTFRLIHKSFEKYKNLCLKEGRRDGQFKMVLLMQNDDKKAKFLKLVRDV